jgi:general stress protein 26
MAIGTQSGTQHSPAHQENIEKLRHLIKGIKVAMFTTQEENGKLYSRPMMTQEAEFDGELYFFAYENSPKVDQIEKDRRVGVTYAAPDKDRYVALTGTAKVLHDKRIMEQFWNPALKAWFPKGLDDPNLVLLKVNPEFAEYWEGEGKIQQVIDFVKSIVTRKQMEGGENEKLNLK